MASADQTGRTRAFAAIVVALLISGGLAIPLSAAIPGREVISGAVQVQPPQGAVPQNQMAMAIKIRGGPASDGGDLQGASIGQIVADVISEIESGSPPIPPPPLPPGSNVQVFVSRQGVLEVTLIQLGDNNQESPLLLALLPQVWLESAKRRSGLRIYVEILELLKAGPLTPFDISFRLRLNAERTRKYLEFLAEHDALETVERHGKILYGITPAGMSLLERVRAVLFLAN
jgi:predicted transcriptional regulator